MKANPEVDRRALLRRLHLNLLGLPPSFADVEEFQANTSPDALERTVDRLLASPHYGVRWGRHWLDVARFAESHGYEHDYNRLNAYHYRDFVVQTWNVDQPFDEFVQWQMAGDRLAPDDRLAWMATGFLAAGPHSTQITKREVERQRYDDLDDMVSTIGTAILGLNIGCARCHDHPYDPIPQGDFYRFAAFFTRTVCSEIDLDFDPVGYQAARVTFEKAHAPFVDAVKQYETGGLRTAYQDWRRHATPRDLQARWLLPDDIKITSRGEPNWASKPNGSWLIESPSLDTDRYEIVFRSTAKQPITAIRLEALTDPSMVHGGPGRANDGSFRLSHVQLERKRASQPAVAVPIARAVATFEEVGAGLANVLDDRPDTAWGIDPQLGRNHAAVLRLAKPVELRADEKLCLILEFTDRPKAAIGRLRISFSAEPNPSIDAETIPLAESVFLARQRDPSQLTSGEWSAITRWFAPQDDEWRRLNGERETHAATAPQPILRSVLVATEGRPAIRLHTQATQDFLPETQYLQRGDPARPVGMTTPAVLQLFSDGSDDSHDRTDLARWLTNVEQGAGALTARVIVNRLWQHHFGTGLVATPDDFGQRGAFPSHSQLLDWLARELIRHHWQLKSIQRLIVTSAAYQRSAFPTQAAMERDPENHTLWRWSPRRLEAEVVRDALRVSSDQLDNRLDGPSEHDLNHRRRAIYGFIKRSAPDPWLMAFDGPDGCRVEGRRLRTITPVQSLALLNSEFTQSLADEFVRRIRTESDPVASLFHQLFQRTPTPQERQRVTRFLGANPTQETWIDLCQVLWCLDEFVFLD